MSIQPLISIVIPTHGRPEKLRTCLQAIGDLHYPKDRFEVIAVDDGSPVPVEGSIASFSDLFPLRVLRQENRGPAVARNAGMRSATGRLVAFTDDDCRPRRDWLTHLAEGHMRHPGAALGGRVHNALPNRIGSEASQLLVDYLYEYFGTLSKGTGFFTSNNLAFPTKDLQDMGGFDQTFPLAAGEDREICDRWTRHGRPLLYVPEAIVDHAHDLRLSRFARQQFNYGRGAWHFHKARQRSTNTGHRVEPARFYLGMMLYPFRTRNWLQSVPLSFLMMLSQAANAAGFFYERFVQRRTANGSGIFTGGF